MFEKLSNIRVSPIKQFELIASKIPDVVSLAQGIPSFDTPEYIRMAVTRALQEGKGSRYSLSPGLPALREAISEHLEKEGILYDYDSEILCTCGSIEAITASLFALLNPGDEVLLPSPSYASYQEAIKIAGGKPIFVPLLEEENWSLDFQALKNSLHDNTRAIILCNPNNPTGTVYKKEQLLELAEIAKERNMMIISDEVYKDFVYDAHRHYSLACEKSMRKNLIYVFSFSKAYAMTGWRIGFLCAHADVCCEILKIHDSLVTCAPVLSQYAAMAALEKGESAIKHFHETYRKRRDLVLKYLSEFSDVFSYTIPNASYFIFPKVLRSEKNSWDLALDILEKVKVALVPGIAFGPQGEGHLRICFGRSEEDITAAFLRLKKYFYSS